MKLNLAKLDKQIVKNGSFYDFVKMAFPIVSKRVFINAKYIKVICDYYEEIYNGNIKRSVLNVPPSTGKSTIISVLFPVWCWIKDPTLSIISISYSPDLASSFAFKSLELICSPWFQKRWPHISIKNPKKAAKNDYTNTEGGKRFSTSKGAKLTGYHADIIIIDDPNKAGDSKNNHDETIEFFKETLPTRLIDQKTGRISLVMQRLELFDVSNYCINTLKWNSLILPMEFDKKICDPLDWRKEDGELLTSRIDIAALASLKLSLGDYAFAQLQQNPIDVKSSIFKLEYFKYYNELPKNITRYILSFDMAVYAKETSDYSAGLLIAQAGNDFYIIEEYHFKLDFSEAAEKIKEIYDINKKKFGNIKTIIESKASGAAIVNVLKKKLINVEEVNPGSKSKFERAQSITHLFRSGNVYINNIISDEWKDEIVNFPKAKFDDRVDALSQALIYMSNKSSGIWSSILKS